LGPLTTGVVAVGVTLLVTLGVVTAVGVVLGVVTAVEVVLGVVTTAGVVLDGVTTCLTVSTSLLVESTAAGFLVVLVSLSISVLAPAPTAAPVNALVIVFPRLDAVL
jgi:hypothetical protein